MEAGRIRVRHSRWLKECCGKYMYSRENNVGTGWNEWQPYDINEWEGKNENQNITKQDPKEGDRVSGLRET